MTIEWRADDRQFHLTNERISLVLRVYEDGSLGHLHLGAPLPAGRSYRHLGPDPFAGFANRVGDPVPFAYPTPGGGDFRVPALVAAGADGATALALRYRDHRISQGKPDLDGLPSTYAETDDEAETLEVTLVDELTGLEVDLRFTIFAGRSAIARSTTIRAGGSAAVDLRTAMSVSVDLPDAGWVMVGLAGAWARETHVVERALVPGRQSSSSSRGVSSAQHNPFLALRRPTTDEAAGEALAFSLVYSGNFLAEAEVDAFGTTRVRLGIEPETFGWHLEPGASFTTPEAIVAWSDAGLGGLSETLHGLFRERLARGRWRDRPRPILINNWEATYFDVRCRSARRDRPVGAGARDRALRPRRRLVRASRPRRQLARRLGRRPAQAAGGSRRPSPSASPSSGWASACGSSRRWSPPTATCSAPTRTGRSACPGGRGPRAASSSSSTSAGPRWSTT